jgi:hypothetical protein|tara:strand:- start:83 stop:619 length:537 start_codon:yes stop_codon:yes gene_type:complete
MKGVKHYKKNGTKLRDVIKKAKAGKVALTSTEQADYKIYKQEVNEKRLDKRAEDSVKRRKKTGKIGVGTKAKKLVTSDNRKEVTKGSKASGVTVNNKLVRGGKVKAGEAVARKGKKAIAKKVAKKVATRLIPVVGTALSFNDAAAMIAGDYKKSKATKGRPKPTTRVKKAKTTTRKRK